MILALALALALPSFASELEGGPPVTFGGVPADLGTTFDLRRAGEVLWASETSDGASQAFRSLLFQGKAVGADVTFEAQAQDDAGTWSRWTPAELNRFAGGRLWGRFRLTGPAGASIRVRVVAGKSRPGEATVELYSLELGSEVAEVSEAEPSPAPIETEPPDDLPIFPRSAWGAEPSKKPYEPMVPVRISVHHTESFQAMTKAEAIAELRAIQSFHKRGRGWNDIAYHFLIDGGGRIWRGRPETAIGAHVSAKNDGNIGISLMGSFQAPRYNRPTKAQFQSLVRLTQWLVRTYGIDPAHILGHRDQEATSCPGTILYVRLPELRKAAAEAAKQTVKAAEPPAGIIQ